MSSEDAITEHLSAIIAEAARLHKEAMSHLDKPKADPLPQLREAKRLLAEAEILTSDAASYVGTTHMDNALADLHRQQDQVESMIVQVGARKRSTSTGASGWIIIAVLIGIAVVLAV